MSATTRRPVQTIQEHACRSFQQTMELIGRRWSGAIILALSLGATRFGEILTLVDGLSDRLLSQRLKELEAEGIVVRTVVPSTPVQILYALTDSGQELMTVLQPLVDWRQDRPSS
ncbi:MAG TPA: helix-turn-helix domain-containing protein [Kribbella sp.]|jgi:DNA-binding HxlR family transcriptional regulator